jgi:hypothetical protein
MKTGEQNVGLALALPAAVMVGRLSREGYNPPPAGGGGELGCRYFRPNTRTVSEFEAGRACRQARSAGFVDVTFQLSRASSPWERAS